MVQAAWDPDLAPWAVAGSGFDDFTRPKALVQPESWEALAVADTPLPSGAWPPSLVACDLLWVYQHSSSGGAGSRCPFYPSCSRYCRIAVEDYGLLAGCVMGAERLSRCHGNQDALGDYPLIRKAGRYLILDPPDKDAWWKQ
jgi:putative component of membrane protein insertase Oxa1/YidC/SpoIIIJ protein YidD